MALDLVGGKFGADVLDIHAGGVDLIFPHHEDEIAQSCAYTGKPDFARYWLHGEFLNIRGTKMSKRFGNYTTPRDLKADGIDAAAVRLLVFQTHYRQKLDLTDDALEGAREGARRLGEFGDRLGRAPLGPGSTAETEAAGALRSSITEAMNDDLSAPRAVAALFDFVREANRLLDGSKNAGPELRAAWEWAGQVLDVAGSPTATLSLTSTDTVAVTDSVTVVTVGSDAWARGLAVERIQARKSRNFKRSDEIRDELKANGWEVRDTKDGSEVVRMS
jgi:cysteinyl-tRNA synthetase